MNELLAYAKLMDALIPDGTREVEIEGVKYTITKENGEITIESATSTFDDSQILKEIQDLKDLFEEMSDCLFMECSAELGKKTDLNTLSKLFELEHFTQEEAADAKEAITFMTDIFKNRIGKEIETLTRIYANL